MVVEAKQIVIENVWTGLYGESWKGLICDEAFAHPAKFSRALIRKIYDHVIEEQWATRGSSVVDPFGGVALGAFDAMRHGLNWYGCELEAKFVGLGGQNIALWNERFSRMPNWGTARLLQGDSRKLAEVLSAADCCVSSPPYVDAVNASGEGPGMAGNAAQRERIASGSLTEVAARSRHHGYGSSGGQLGAMKEGDHSIAITSPPYAGIRQDGGKIAKENEGGMRPYSDDPVDAWFTTRDQNNLGNLRDDANGFQAAVSSPPYEGIQVRSCDENHSNGVRDVGRHGGKGFTDVGGGTFASEAQLSAQTPETFWSASRLILEQLHQVIVPGGHAVFVVKAFVRDKQIVDFPAQWAQLCEAVGFRLLHHHRASLVENSGTQRGFEQDKEITVERKSFFRRLAEKKGSPRIDHESVLCFERP